MTEPKVALAALGWRVDTTARLAQAVKDFQRGWNLGPALTVDGNPGPKTQAALALSLERKAKGLPDFSAHFSAREFRCACGGADASCRRIWVERALVQAVEKYRTVVGPLKIDRGCRCPQQNAAVGGARNSQHLYGSAADVSVFRVSVAKVRALGVASGIGTYTYGGTGYPRHIDVRHIFTDSRNTTKSTVASPAQWTYGSARYAPLTPRPGLAADPTPAPAPTPAPTPTEEPSMVLIRLSGAPEVYVSNGVARRHVATPAALEDLQRAIRDQGGTGRVTTVADLDAAGGPVATFPAAG